MELSQYAYKIIVFIYSCTLDDLYIPAVNGLSFKKRSSSMHAEQLTDIVNSLGVGFRIYI